MSNELLTPGEVADLFGVTAASVRTWIRAGELPALRTPGGRGLRVRRSDVDSYLDRATATNGKGAA